MHDGGGGSSCHVNDERKTIRIMKNMESTLRSRVRKRVCMYLSCRIHLIEFMPQLVLASYVRLSASTDRLGFYTRSGSN
jgi:hypothetical protein